MKRFGQIITLLLALCLCVGVLPLTHAEETCAHEYDVYGNCIKCGYCCPHQWENGHCSLCGNDCLHDYVDNNEQAIYEGLKHLLENPNIIASLCRNDGMELFAVMMPSTYRYYN
jgi:hypothetical protein